ncbi:MAG: hypothetical protein C4326_09480 [Ignavibacteria bacterium]
MQYLWKSLIADPLRLVSSEFHLTFVKACIRLLTAPLTSKLWSDDRGWRSIRRTLHRWLGRSKAEPSAATMPETASPAHGTPRRLYDKIQMYRLIRLKQFV